MQFSKFNGDYTAILLTLLPILEVEDSLLFSIISSTRGANKLSVFCTVLARFLMPYVSVSFLFFRPFLPIRQLIVEELIMENI